MSNENKTNKIQTIMIICSIVAIVIAFLTLYYQFFHKANDLSAYLIDCKNYDNKFFFRFIIINKGNQQGSLLELKFRFLNKYTKEGFYRESAVNFNDSLGLSYSLVARLSSIDPKDSLNIKTPYFIRPGEMCVLKLVIDYDKSFLSSRLIKYEPVSIEYFEKNVEKYLPIVFIFESMNSKGNKYTKKCIISSLLYNETTNFDVDYRTDRIKLFSESIKNPYNFPLANNELPQSPLK